MLPKFSTQLLVVCIWRHQRHDYANYNQFVPNFDMAYKTTQRVSVPNLKVIWTNQNRAMGQRSWSIFYHVVWEHSFADQNGRHNINVWRFSQLWTAVTLAFIGISGWNLQRSFKMGLFTLCKNLSENSLIQTLMTSLQTKNCCSEIALKLNYAHVIIQRYEVISTLRCGECEGYCSCYNNYNLPTKLCGYIHTYLITKYDKCASGMLFYSWIPRSTHLNGELLLCMAELACTFNLAIQFVTGMMSHNDLSLSAFDPWSVSCCSLWYIFHFPILFWFWLWYLQIRFRVTLVIDQCFSSVILNVAETSSTYTYSVIRPSIVLLISRSLRVLVKTN